MNAKLKALAEQAGYFIAFEQNARGQAELVFTNTPGIHGDLELFAKLIVAECVALAKQKARTIKARTHEHSTDLGEYATGLRVSWQVEVFADELQQLFEHTAKNTLE